MCILYVRSIILLDHRYGGRGPASYGGKCSCGDSGPLVVQVQGIDGGVSSIPYHRSDGGREEDC